MDPSHTFYELIDKERNVYEPARLYHQNRRDVAEYVSFLRSVDGERSELYYEDGALVSKESGHRYRVTDNIADFVHDDAEHDSEWERLNQSFLNYHRSLTSYTLLNSAPVINLMSERSGIGEMQDVKVVDVGGGTGHTLCSFFRAPETIDYYLVDPNVRLLHDHFLRFYPKLAYLEMAHVLASAEKLPFKDSFADVVMSLSSVDHFADFRAFIGEATRILKPRGRLFISSHLDIPARPEDVTQLRGKLLSPSLPERIARYIYFRRYRVGRDDHTYHFTGTAPLEDAIVGAGLEIDKSEVIKRYFCLVAVKP